MKTKTILMFYAALFGTAYSDIIDDFLAEKHQFIAITAVVLLDLCFGVVKALRFGNYKTKKAFKSVFILVAFWSLLAVVLLIEKAYPFMTFLSEMILLPIILFQLISILKSMQILELINNETLKNILSNIDKHKESES